MARGKRAGVRAAAPPDPLDEPPAPPVAAPGQPYGDRQATEAQASASPMYDEPVSPQSAPVGVSPGAMPDAFGPTNRSQESMTAGLPTSSTEADAVGVLRAIYASFPSPWIAALIGDDY